MHFQTEIICNNGVNCWNLKEDIPKEILLKLITNFNKKTLYVGDSLSYEDFINYGDSYLSEYELIFLNNVENLFNLIGGEYMLSTYLLNITNKFLKTSIIYTTKKEIFDSLLLINSIVNFNFKNNLLQMKVIKENYHYKSTTFEANTETELDFKIKTFPFFGTTLNEDLSNKILPFLKCRINEPINSFLSEYSRKQQKKFKDNILNTKNCYLLNIFELFRITYPNEVNIDHFINCSNVYGEIYTEYDNDKFKLFSDFLKKYISYSKFLNYIKKEPNALNKILKLFSNFNFLQENLESLINNQLVYNSIKEFLATFKIKKIAQTFDCVDFHYFHALLLLNKERYYHIERKQQAFFKNNKNFVQKNTMIEIPKNFDDFIRGSYFFNNCIASESFFSTFKKKQYLFFIKGEVNICVLIDHEGSIIEARSINNTECKQEELIYNVIKQLTIF